MNVVTGRGASPATLWMCVAVAAVALPSIGAAWAQEPPAATLPTVEAIGITPLPAGGVPRDRIPGNPRSFSAADLARDGRPDLVDTMVRLSAGVTVNDAQGNAFAPDVQYRGFAASPLVGTPQGLAVYQNGVRINEAFGDTVNWDLIPSNANRSVDLIGSNPIFGLNAIGGALALRQPSSLSPSSDR